jgi:uncharacterized membrane protein/predicted DsbA family dithiol-disulfide isomerase
MRSARFSLIALGLALSGYLLFRHLELASASGPLQPSPCSALLKTDCDAALRSPAARQLGLPLAGWGTVYFGTLLTLLLLGWLLGDAFQLEAALAMLVLCTLGAASSVLLIAVMFAGKAPFCPLCAGVHLTNFLLVAVCFLGTGRPARQLFRAVVDGGRRLLSGTAGREPSGQMKLLALCAGALVAVALYQWVFILEKLHSRPEYDPRDALASFAMSVRAEIPVSEDDPCAGPGDAPIRLVIFSDYQCAGCRRLPRELDRLVTAAPGKIQVVFKHFPLCKDCNSLVADDRHPRACEAARAAEAARRQGKFWDFHHALFAADLSSPRVTLEGIAQQAALDLARFETDRRGDQTLAKVLEDVELGIRLGVVETPTVFVNGRHSSDVRTQFLHLLIASEIANQTRYPVAARKTDKTLTAGK